VEFVKYSGTHNSNPAVKCPSDIKPKAELQGGEPPGLELINGHSSNDLEEPEEDEDSDSSSPPLPYLQAPAPDGCCTLDGNDTNTTYVY